MLKKSSCKHPISFFEAAILLVMTKSKPLVKVNADCGCETDQESDHKDHGLGKMVLDPKDCLKLTITNITSAGQLQSDTNSNDNQWRYPAKHAVMDVSSSAFGNYRRARRVDNYRNK